MTPESQTWSSNGKLLITGEYLVMEGALSLALPLRVGQSLKTERTNNNFLHWQANKLNGVWFTADYELPSFRLVYSDDKIIAERLKRILLAAVDINASFLANSIGYNVTTDLGFYPEFGFGTSSTLISNIAMWAEINPYHLLQKTFGGSGYDIACADKTNPIFYQLVNDEPKVINVDFYPIFKDNLYFIYLGKKQSSTDGIMAFNEQGKFSSIDINNISVITKEIIKTRSLSEFEQLLTEHEQIMSKVLKLRTAKSIYFNDYTGAVKSLGAWGGDFVLVTSAKPESKLRSYMQNKGFDTVLTYDELVL